MELFIVPFNGQGTFPVYLQHGSYEELTTAVCQRLDLPETFRASNVLKFVTNGGKRLDPPLSRERCKSVIQKECNDPTSMTYHQQDVDTNLVESYKLEKMERIERMQDVTPGTTIHLHLLLRGGKGGYGALLRIKSKQRGAKRTTNFGACRDLNGRRLRHVNDEILLAKWKEAREKGEKFDASQGTTQGIDGWFLGIPNWADLQGVVANAMLSKKAQKKAERKSKYKSILCSNWLAARSTGRMVPTGAPRHYGCPQGTRCRFAHGEEELQGQAAVEYRKRVADEKLRVQQEQRDKYISADSDSYYEQESILSMVQAGLGQAKKRSKREATEEGTDETTTALESKQAVEEGEEDDDDDDDGEEPEGLGAEHLDKLASLSVPATSSDYSGVFHIQCVRGDVDVTTVSREERHVYTCEGISSFGTVAMRSPTSSYFLDNTSTSHERGVNGQENRSVVGDVSWCYEVTLVSGGLAQIGWAQPECSLLQSNTQKNVTLGQDGDEKQDTGEGEDGCGDDMLSYGYDGSRGLLWHASSSAYPATSATSGAGKRSSEVLESSNGAGSDTLWKAGDVITTILTISRSSSSSADPGADLSIMYYLNGTSLGSALKKPISSDTYGVSDPGVCPFIPCLSLEAQEVVEVNLGGRVFSHPPMAVRPVLEASFPPSAHISSSNNTLPSSISTNNSASSTAASPSVTLEDLADPAQYPSLRSLEAVGHATLKAALAARGVKSGGTLPDKAKRYLMIRGMEAKDIPVKLLSKSA